MSLFTLTFVITSLCIVSSLIFRSDSISYASFCILKKGVADSGSVLKELKSKTAVQCTLGCVFEPSCKSLNYKAADGRCQFIERWKKASAPFLIKKAGWIHITTDQQVQEKKAKKQSTQESDIKEEISQRCSRQLPCKNNTCTNLCTGTENECFCHRKYCGQHSGSSITDCTSVYASGSEQDGVYNINVNGSGLNMNVFCDMTDKNEGWIVIQRRINDSVDFYRNWTAYKEGFGDLSGSMWIGLDNLHLLAGPGKRAILRVDLKHYTEPNITYFAEYRIFEIGNEAEKYKLAIGGYSGNAGDSMVIHNGMKFSTYDNDNDLSMEEICALRWRGAWWYNHCHEAKLNGLYPVAYNDQANHMSWYRLKSNHGNIIYSEMKIKYD